MNCSLLSNFWDHCWFRILVVKMVLLNPNVSKPIYRACEIIELSSLWEKALKFDYSFAMVEYSWLLLFFKWWPTFLDLFGVIISRNANKQVIVNFKYPYFLQIKEKSHFLYLELQEKHWAWTLNDCLKIYTTKKKSCKTRSKCSSIPLRIVQPKTWTKGTMRFTVPRTFRDPIKASVDQCFGSGPRGFKVNEKIELIFSWSFFHPSLFCTYKYNLWWNGSVSRLVSKWSWILILVHQNGGTLFEVLWKFVTIFPVS